MADRPLAARMADATLTSLELISLMRRARELIDTPDKWTQGAYRKDAAGNFTDRKEEAVCRCMLGAIMDAGGDTLESIASMQAIALLERVIDLPSIRDWNDASKRIHADILTAIDTSIRVEEWGWGNPVTDITVVTHFEITPA